MARGDSELVGAARAGSSLAFRALVDRYQGVVLSIAYAVTGRAGQSEEIAQETFVVAWRRLSEMEQPERFRGWICGIARRVAHESQRKLRRLEVESSAALAPDPQIPSPEPSPLERIISDEEQRLLWQALRRVPERYRLPLVLVYQEQQSIEEVAESLDLSTGNVRQRLLRGRKMLEKVAVVMRSLGPMRPRKDLGAAVLLAIATGVSGAARAASATAQPRLAPELSPAGKAVRLVRLARARPALWGIPTLIVGALVVYQVTRTRRGSEALEPGRAAAAATRSPPRWNAEVTPELRRGTEGLASAPVGAPPTTGPIALFHFDFEDGLLRKGFSLGQVVPADKAPAGLPEHNRFVATATVTSRPSMDMVVELGDWSRGLFDHTPDLVVSFDYFLGADAPALTVRVSTARSAIYRFQARDAVRDRWAHADVRVSDMVLHAPGEPSAAGAAGASRRIQTVSIVGGKLGGRPVVIDNFAVLRYPRGELPPTTVFGTIAPSR